MNRPSTHILIGYIHERLLNGNTEVTVSPDADLLSSGLVDSIGMMQLIGFIEEEFDIKVPPEDMVIENFLTIDAISSYIERRKIN